MGNTCCCSCRKKLKKNICLLLLGLDNAGKTVAVKNLAGEPTEEVVPTVGFSVVNLRYNGYKVNVYDLGGGATIRGIWHRYFVDAHGIIFVIDSSDFSRLNEVKEVLYDVLSHEKISGKPVLILANKQDHDNAMDELDLIETLQLEELVNRQQCPTLVESCSATSLTPNKAQADPGIRKGYNWLMSCIIREYKYLNERVLKDVQEEEIAVAKNRQEIIDRLKAAKEVKIQKQDDIIELYSDYASKNGNVVKPLDGSLSISSPESSKRSTPKTYRSNETEQTIVERPKSATQKVKEYLEIHHTEEKMSWRLQNNKIQPVNFYGTASSHSAQVHRRSLSNDRRALRSAGDSVFVTSNGGDVISNHTGGGDIHQQLFQMKRIKYKESHNTPRSSGDNAISVIEVD